MASKLRKSKEVFFHFYRQYKKAKSQNNNSSTLSRPILEELRQFLTQFQEALLNKDREKASQFASQSLNLEKKYFPLSRYKRWAHWLFSNVFFIALLITLRLSWFELYQIPTGSMRPTLKEEDRLVVSKSQFGINIPFLVDHFYFDTNEVKRGGIVVLTGENMDIDQVKTKYFYLFDGYKQYVKRLIGKPGDTLYFYGGKIYGIDSEGNDISSELQTKEQELIEHIPFMRLEGKTKLVGNSLLLYHANTPVARVDMTPSGQLVGRLLYHQETAQNYEDLFGIKHFGMARILEDQDRAYLEISHHPSLKQAKLSRLGGYLAPVIGHSTSTLPLTEEHLKKLFQNMNTVRFVIKEGLAYHYDFEESKNFDNKEFRPKLANIPDGTYEFFYGKGYKIGFEGYAKQLPTTHPLMQYSRENTITLFNFGIDLDTRFGPNSPYKDLLPRRYVYFRDNDLYLLGAPIVGQEDPILREFLANEEAKGELSSQKSPYYPFKDYGPPLKSDGTPDIELIRANGLVVPKGKYFCLGDNHAVSADCRDFGFVPEKNLRGTPSYIITPLPSLLNQPPYPLFTVPRLIVWSIVAAILLMRYIYIKRNYTLPLEI